jgi:hypothetical protein
MAIANTDILYFLSGGGANTDPNASLGGAISSTQITTASLQNLYDAVSGAEEAAGDVEYRGFYVKNNHGSLTLSNAVIWISTNTPATDTDVAIAVSAQGQNVTMTAIANESTAPATVSFTSPSTAGAGLSLGNLAAGSYIGVWVRWTVTAGAAANASDNVIFTVQGDSPP